MTQQTDAAHDDVTAGVEKENSAVPGDAADLYAFVDDGEYATVWCVFRESDYEISTTTYRVEAGVAHRDGHSGKNYFDVPTDKSTHSWAAEYAEAHKSSVQTAREYFDA